MVHSNLVRELQGRIARVSFVRFIISLLLLCWGFMGALALSTASLFDASCIYSSTQTVDYFNIFGWLGAQYAATILFLFGSGGYCVHLALVVASLLCLSRWLTIDRAAGFALCVVSLCSSLFFYDYDPIAGIVPGGVFGARAVGWLSLIFDQTALALFIILLATIGILLATEVSIIWVGMLTYRVGAFLLSWQNTIRPAIAYSFWVAHQMSVLVCMMLVQVAEMLTGKEITDSTTIVDFEELAHAATREPSDDDRFWQELADQQEKTSVEMPEPLPLQDVKAPEPMSDPIESPRIETVKEVARELPKKVRYSLPSVALFKRGKKAQATKEQIQAYERLAEVLEEKLERFGIKGEVTAIKVGPVITLFEYEPDIDSKISKIIALEDDLALALQALSIRIIAPIPGTAVVGFEVANKQRNSVFLSTAIHSNEFKNFDGYLPLILGEDVIGSTVIMDLAKAPHLLVAGSTGSGKSVALNVMLVSLLFKYKPEELRLILIDPKRLEFATYADTPHLVFPIITDPRKAAPVLKWVVQTMEERYSLMQLHSVRNIFDYQELCKRDSSLDPMPFLVVVIDELSDLMMTAGKDIEDLIARIAQMARAAGIHMIVATQRPSVDVITGLIKVNFPTRISFKVTSKVDSRTILDCMGADKLLGKGDMLYLDSASELKRAHGAYVSSEEIDTLVSYVKSQAKPNYVDLREALALKEDAGNEQEDELYTEVRAFLATLDEVSISLLQRKFRIGYNRSARIIEQLEAEGLIIQDPNGKTRKVIHE